MTAPAIRRKADSHTGALTQRPSMNAPADRAARPVAVAA